MLLSIAMAVTNASIEGAVRMLLNNPDIAVKSFAVAGLQLIVGVIFGYLAVGGLGVHTCIDWINASPILHNNNCVADTDKHGLVD
jgi:hypothetical protein